MLEQVRLLGTTRFKIHVGREAAIVPVVLFTADDRALPVQLNRSARRVRGEVNVDFNTAIDGRIRGTDNEHASGAYVPGGAFALL